MGDTSARTAASEALAGLVERVTFHNAENGFLIGGVVVIKVADETVGGIGATGAPGGYLNEACAGAGLDKIRDKLE